MTSVLNLIPPVLQGNRACMECIANEVFIVSVILPSNSHREDSIVSAGFSEEWVSNGSKP